MPSTESGSDSRAARRRSRGSAPRDRTRCRRRARRWRSTTASDTSPSASRTSFSLARFDSGPRLITCGARACQRSGNRSSTSGRASASTMKRLRRAGCAARRRRSSPCRDRPSADPRAPAAPGAPRTRPPASPPRRGAWRRPSAAGSRARRASASFWSSGNGDVRDLAQEGGDARAASRSTCRATRAVSLSRLLSIGFALVDAGRAADGAPQRRERRARAQRIAVAEQHLARDRAGAAPSRRTPARSRDLPTPAAPIDHAPPTPSTRPASPRTGRSASTSRGRGPTKSVALPSRLRLTSNTSRSPRRNDAVPSRRTRSARRAARPRRRRAGSRPAAVPRSRRMPLSITSPATDQAENRPGAGRHHQRHVGQHGAHAPARSAPRAPPDRSPCPRRAASARPTPSGSGCSRAPCARSQLVLDRRQSPQLRRSPRRRPSTCRRAARVSPAPAPLGRASTARR